MRQYLKYVTDQRVPQLELPKKYDAKRPFDFMNLQEVQGIIHLF